MGHRACYLLIKNEKERAFYYSRYGSIIMDDNILGGFSQLVSSIERKDVISEAKWLSLGGGQDGGLLLDYQQRVLVWYGEEKTNWDPVYRGVFLKVARQLWKGWDIRWAYNSERDILDYAGYPREPLYLEDFKQVSRIHLDPAHDGSIKESSLPGILSIIDSEQQCRLIPLDQPVYSYLLSGPAFFSNWKEVPQLESLLIDTTSNYPFWDERDPHVPHVPHECYGGIHLNLLEQKLDYWAKYFKQGDEQLIFPMWPGWKITIHYDEFEWQEKITKGALSFKVKSISEILEEMLPLRVWSEKPGELDNQEIEETIAKLATRPYGPALIIKIMVYLILLGILILFLWVLVA